MPASTSKHGLLLRVLSAIAFVPLFVWITARGGALFTALVVVILILGAAEAASLFARLGFGGSSRARAIIGTLLALVYPGALGVFLLLLRGYEPPGPLYLRPSGASLVFFLFSTTWGCDTAAYFAGRAFGRRKLAPGVSPNKTWEGALAGFAAAAACGWIASKTFAAFLPPAIGVALGAVMGIAGQLGDLAESALKRRARAKDAGSIIPGHGGVLDRFDSVLVNAPILYGLLLLLESRSG